MNCDERDERVDEDSMLSLGVFGRGQSSESYGCWLMANIARFSFTWEGLKTSVMVRKRKIELR